MDAARRDQWAGRWGGREGGRESRLLLLVTRLELLRERDLGCFKMK